jgi:tetratricopeptide (TPR) repeat protein
VAPFDREGALKRAEKALRLGKVDAAIDEYQALVLAQPRDWNSANALGDLFVRAGQLDKGVEQYTRIADHLADEGFYPKASALFKKILKVKATDEYALIRRVTWPPSRVCSRRESRSPDGGRPPPQDRQISAAPPRWPSASAWSIRGLRRPFHGRKGRRDLGDTRHRDARVQGGGGVVHG